MKKLLILIPLILGICFMYAQASEYTFAQSMETYTEISGGTVVATGTIDDTQYAITPPFAFTFAGTPVTAMAMSSNGYLSINAGTSSFGYAAISSSTLGAGVVTPLSRDLRGGTTGEMRWEVFGEAPNRYAIYQWKNWRDYSGSADDSWNFQVFLYETTNNIAIRYGNFTWAGTYTNSYQVGIRGATNANFNNRTTTTDWSATTTGATNTATCLVSTAIFPSTGLQFAYNYPVASTPPNAPLLASPANGGWALTNATLNWISGGGMPDTYDVYLDTVDGSTLVSNDQMGTSYTPTLIPGITYFWKVIAANSFGDGPASAVWSFTTPSATQLAESFEATTFPPAGWANGSSGNWTRSTGTPIYHGTAKAYKYTSTSLAYQLSTPRVTIVDGSSLDFWTYASSTSQVLQAVYSDDRVTWTQVGSNITYPATSTWYHQVVDLSSLAGNNYYLAFQTPVQTSAGSVYVDFVFGPEITPEAPGAPVLTAPADLAVNVNEFTTLTWTAPVTGGVPTGYNIYLDTVDGSTLFASNVTSPYTLTTALAYNTTYYWTVEAYNGAGTSPVATVRSFTTRANPTISAFPWEVNFGTVSGDWPVLNWSQLINQYGTTLVAGTRWYQDDFANVTTPLNKAAKMNIWSANYGWIITPPIAVPATGYELKFDIALTVYAGTSAVTAGGQPDDKFMVLVDDNPMMTSPTILREWNNSGSPYVYDNVSNTGETHTFNLDAYTGTVYFAFYGESSVSNGDNDFFVDNVIVREVPLTAIFSLTPDVDSWDFGLAPVNIPKTKVFTISNTGGAPLTLSSVTATGDYYSISEAPAIMTIPVGGSTTFTVQYLPTVAGGPYNGSLDIVFSRETRTITLSGSAYEPAVLPIVEGFETGLGEWVVENGSQINAWYAGTATFNSGAQSAYISNDGGITNSYTNSSTSIVHLYKDIVFTSGADRYNLNFNWKGYGESSSYDYLQVFLVDTAVDPVAGTRLTTGQIGVNYNLQNDWQLATLQIPNTVAGQVKRLVFSWWNDSSVGTQPPIAVDDISLVAVFPSAPEPVTITYPANEATNLSINGFDITWTPSINGGIPTYYAVYMSQDESTIYDDLYFETSDTNFNPVADGSVAFNYLERWYYTVQAFNVDGDAIVEPAQWFEIEDAPSVITIFPWNENFDAAAALPDDWTVADVDGAGTNWVSSPTYSHSAPNSFKHAYSTATPDPGENGWLITPAIQVPAGNYYLSWWNYNYYPTYLVYNGVKVNTTNDPAAAGWTELWTNTTPATAWSQAAINISAYADQTVYFAFNYTGYDGDDWYIDDVSVYELTVDTFGPTITHLPIINTPREDTDNLVYAEIVDDATWNNPVGGAVLFYATDGGTNWTGPVFMTADVAPGYYAYIPAQPLGTTVDYYIEAWDSLDNTTASDVFSFTVADPTWIWYDQGGSTYMGYTTTDFGPTVLFENPFFGTGNAMQLLTTDGSSYYGNAANLQIWTYDGINDLVPYFVTPIPITFGAQTYETFDLSTHNVQISAPYFFVSYLDVPMGNYILFDGTYNYGTSYVFQGTTLYTMSNPGSWAIGANVTTGMSLALDAPVVTVTIGAIGIDLTWDAINGASSYQVFGAADPYAADPWTLLGTVVNPGYTYSGTANNQFFKVVADSEVPIRVTTGINTAPVKINARSIKATPAPKGTINLRNRNK